MSADEKKFVADVKQIVAVGKAQAYRAVNMMLVVSNWLVGKRIVEQEQHGEARADRVHVIELASQGINRRIW